MLGEGVNGSRTLLKNVDYDATHFQMGSLKVNIPKELFWEGGFTKKSRTNSVIVTPLFCNLWKTLESG